MELILLIISVIILCFLLNFLKKKNKSYSNKQLIRVWGVAIILMMVWCIPLIFQILLSNRLGIPPIYFDYIVYIGTCFLPVAVFIFGRIYLNTKIKVTKKYFLLLIIPIISLIGLWTNNWHHCFFKKYSMDMTQGEGGWLMYMNSTYLYILTGIGILNLLKFSVKNSGFFSKQSLLIIVSILIPLMINLLGTFKFIPMTIYITPICFTLTLIILTYTIFKFNFFGSVPIAIQKIVDVISDGYIVIDENNIITDFNKTFLDIFNLRETELRNQNIYYLFKNLGKKDDYEKIKPIVEKVKNAGITQVITEKFGKIEKIFTIEISAVTNDDLFIGTVMLFKDITQHTNDMKTIEENQYVMQRQAQFAILGEFAGGLAHDLNSPLSAVQLDVSTLQKYIKSDKIYAEPEVRETILDMLQNIDSSLNKMAGTISGVRDQIRSTGNTEKEEFNLREIIDGIEILFGSILRKNNCSIENCISSDIILYGEKNKLDRVIGNIVKNSIDAYCENKKKGKIVVYSRIIDDNCIIAVEDKAGGLDKDVAETMFKKMKTTKKDNGTGFGLYYSNAIIESSFNGKMYFDSESGVGTTFYVEIPMVREENNNG